MPLNDEDKQIDLHPSEWHHEEKHEPVLGYNGLFFIIMFLLSFPITAIASLIVTGRLPYYLQHLLQ